MAKFFRLSLLGTLFSTLLIGGCGTEVLETERGQITDIDHVEQQAPDELHTYVDNLDPSPTDGFQGFWDTVTAYFKYTVSSYKVTYLTVDPTEGLIEVSGLLVVPWNRCGKPTSVPMLSLQHPTQVERKYSPSDKKVLDPELTVPVALAIAATGYIVVVPDYPGMGVDPGVHPYCHTSIATSVIDMMRAGRDSQKLPMLKTSWNNQLYMIGYSEGGYVTMVTAREIQTQHTDEFTVNAAATLDGPYSLSDTMRGVMLNADTTYSAPYFLPYTLKAYGAIYGGDFDFNFAVKNSIDTADLATGSNFATDLYNLLTGSYSGDTISKFMEKVTPYIGPKSILTNPFIEDLQNTASMVCQKLAQNDAYLNFVPQMPVKMFHNSLDDLVPVGNADNAWAAFQKAGATTVEYEQYTDYIHGLGSIHAGACPVAYYKGYMWLDAIAYPDRHH